jgi:hypothetical protein
LIEPDDHRRARGGDPGHGFEEGIRIAKAQARNRQRDGAEGGDHHPGGGGQQEGLPGGQHRDRHPVGERQADTQEDGEHGGSQEHPPVRMTLGQIRKGGQPHGNAQHRQHDADQKQDGADIDHLIVAFAFNPRMARMIGRH